jgi:hypothetical protein
MTHSLNAISLHVGRHCLPALLVSFLSFCSLHAQNDAQYWDVRLAPPGVSGEVKVLAVSGEDVYVGGDFQRAGDLQVNNIARWNTRLHRWYPLGEGGSFNLGVTGEVLAITVAGDQIYVGGQFTHAGGVASENIAVYTPSANRWAAFGGGAGGNYISSILLKGSDVYVGGSFTVIGTSLLANNIARWDGTQWNRVGTGVDGEIVSMAFVGNDLYAGGTFTTAGGVPASHFARWDGTAWNAVGSGIEGPVRVLLPAGSDLYIGGSFTMAGGVAANNIVRFVTGSATYTAMGTGVSHPDPSITPSVNTIVVLGNELYIGGNFRTAGADSAIARHFAHWDGSKWGALRPANDSLGRGIGSDKTGFAVINAMIPVGGELIIGGRFDKAYMKTSLPQPSGDRVYEGYSALNIVRWNLTEKIWRSFADVPNGVIDAGTTVPSTNITGMVLQGDEIILGGRFTTAGGIPARNVARWNYRTNVWSAVGSRPVVDTERVTAVASGGGSVYVAQSRKVFRWDGTAWTQLGSQLDEPVVSLAVKESILYAGTTGLQGGLYTWNGTVWSSVGGGVRGTVYAIVPDKNGIYVGGSFAMAGSVAANNIAFWDGSQWSALGQGTDSSVYSIAPGVGALFIGGEFTTAGGAPANRVAQYDVPTKTWFPLGNGLDATVRSMGLKEGIVYAAGAFTTTGGVTVRRIALFDGEVWTELGGGTNGAIDVMIVDNASIFAAGNFDVAGVTPSFGLARWSKTVASVTGEGALKSVSAILSVSPNPVGERLSIGLQLDRHQYISVRIVDPLGREVARMHDGDLVAGNHYFDWNSATFPAGIYFCQSRLGNAISVCKIVVQH